MAIKVVVADRQPLMAAERTNHITLGPVKKVPLEALYRLKIEN